MMTVTTKEALKLIENFCIGANYPLESVLEFIKKEGAPNLMFEKGADMIRYNEISNKARKFLEEDREKTLQEITLLGQEMSPEDYETWFSGHHDIW